MSTGTQAAVNPSTLHRMLPPPLLHAWQPIRRRLTVWHDTDLLYEFIEGIKEGPCHDLSLMRIAIAR